MGVGVGAGVVGVGVGSAVTVGVGSGSRVGVGRTGCLVFTEGEGEGVGRVLVLAVSGRRTVKVGRGSAVSSNSTSVVDRPAGEVARVVSGPEEITKYSTPITSAMARAGSRMSAALESASGHARLSRGGSEK